MNAWKSLTLSHQISPINRWPSEENPGPKETAHNNLLIKKKKKNKRKKCLQWGENGYSSKLGQNYADFKTDKQAKKKKKLILFSLLSARYSNTKREKGRNQETQNEELNTWKSRILRRDTNQTTTQTAHTEQRRRGQRSRRSVGIHRGSGVEKELTDCLCCALWKVVLSIISFLGGIWWSAERKRNR